MINPEVLARTAARPKTQRLVGVDATRGLALLGMIAIHALWAYDANGNVSWTFDVAAGRSAATFAVLAGVGVAFMTGKVQVPSGERKAVAASLAARAMLIGLIGLALGGFADAHIAFVILAYYAVLFLLAIPLTYLPTWAVGSIGAVVALGMPLLSHVLRRGLPEPSGLNPSFDLLFHDPGGLLVELAVTGVYPALPWMAYICAGIVVGRLRLSSPRVAAGLFFGGLIAAISASAVSWLALGPLGGRDQLYATASVAGMTSTDVTETLMWGSSGTTPTSTWWWMTTDAAHTSTPVDLLHTIGVAVALLGAFLLLARFAAAHQSVALTAGLTALGAAGSMTLTLYTAHVIFMNSPLDVFDANQGYIVQVIAAVVFALLWRRTARQGPLEAMVAAGARWARQAVTAQPSTARSPGAGSASNAPPADLPGQVPASDSRSPAREPSASLPEATCPAFVATPPPSRSASEEPERLPSGGSLDPVHQRRDQR